MQFHVNKTIVEFRQIVDMFWWSFIKAPAALLAAWAFFSMLSNPSHVATQTMRIADSGSLPSEMMTGIMTVWFLSACAMFAVSLVGQFVFKVRTPNAQAGTPESVDTVSFHP